MPHRPMNREQPWLLPPSLDEVVPADHPARFVAEFIDALDRDSWADMGIDLDGDPLGAPAYHPRALLSVWVYGFMTGVRSSRKLEAACREQLPYLWLTGCQTPDHLTLWRFYAAHRAGMRHLFTRTVRAAMAMQLVDLAVQAVDGTKVGANVAGARTYEAAGLRRLLGRVERAIDELEAQHAAGDGPAAARLPAALADRRRLQAQVRAAVDTLQTLAAPQQINLTDPDARLMKPRRGLRPAYNAQAMVAPVERRGDGASRLITAVAVVDAPGDAAQLRPMLAQAEAATGAPADLTLADAGYHSGAAPAACARRGQRVAMPEAQARALQQPYHKDRFVYDAASDSYHCPAGQRLRFTRHKRTRGVPMRLYRVSGAVCRACPAFGICTTDGQHGRALEIGPHVAVLRRHRAWMATREAQHANQQRQHLVEPVFGIIKAQLRARRFLLRGLANAKAEWALLATAFNLRTLWRLWRAPPTRLDRWDAAMTTAATPA